MDSDFLLQSETSKILFHSYAEDMPIFDWHCHLSPKEIYENKNPEDIKTAGRLNLPAVLELLVRIELTTSSLPRMCSTD